MGQPAPVPLDERQMERELIETFRADPSFLRIVHSMMRAYAVERELKEDPIIDYTIDGTPIRENAFFEAADKGVEKVLNGGGTPADEFFKKKEEWLKNIE